MSATLGELAAFSGTMLNGDPDCVIHSVNTLKSAQQGEISFLSNRRYASQLAETRASAVILSRKDAEQCPVFSLISDNPYFTYASITNFLFPDRVPATGISDRATIGQHCELADDICIEAGVIIGNGVRIGSASYIGSGCIIRNDVAIGSHARLLANVTVCHQVCIGNHVILHPGVVVGSDGFGLAQNGEEWVKIAQLGSVEIHDHVEIGANSTVDRGAIENTVIYHGVKIDNQVQIAHNVIVGENTVIAGCTALAGSCIIGKRCRIGGCSVISGHIQIADDVMITGMSAVSNSIKKAGVYSSGMPATDNRTWRRNITRFRHLDEIIRKILSKID